MSANSCGRYILRVNKHHPAQASLPSRLKHLVADLFRLDISEPDSISDDAQLIGGSLGLDSLDALELAICIEEEFGLTIQSREDSQHAFASISNLAKFIHSHAQINPDRLPRPVDTSVSSEALPAPSPV